MIRETNQSHELFTRTTVRLARSFKQASHARQMTDNLQRSDFLAIEFDRGQDEHPTTKGEYGGGPFIEIEGWG
jgi:hypothetical protein